MQCFGGCFAAQKEDSCRCGGPAVVGADVTSSSSGSSKCALPSATASSKASPDAPARSKSKLRLLSSMGSKKQLEGPTYTPTEASNAEDRAQLFTQHLMQHGRQILGVSSLQQQQLHHFVMPGIGYIAYAWMQCTSAIERQVPAALSDPICDRQHFRTMAEAFLREHPNALFVQVSHEFACILQELDFTCNSMGGETRLDIATYDFTGYARRGLRSAISGATKEGLKVEEVMHPAADTFGTGAAKGAGAAAAAAAGTDWAALREEMQEVDIKWAANKAGRAHDVWFINRPPVFAPEAGVRKFVARNAAGELQGYIFFDAVFDNGQVTGYYANVTRMLPDAHPGTLNLIIKSFLDRVRAETQLAAPVKKLSMRKSQRKKLEAAAAAAASDISLALPDQQPKQQQQEAAAPSGPTFLSLGLSPFYQMNNKPAPSWKSCTLTYLLLLLSYEDGEAFYPFVPLAAAKAKYGAGLRNFKYEDPNVEYRNAFLCHRFKNPYTVFWRMFDLASLYGFWSGPADCFGRYFEYKGKQGALLMAEVLRKASSLDTYKPKQAKKKAKRSKSLGSSASSASLDSKASSSAGAGEEGMARSKSAPADIVRAAAPGARKKQAAGGSKAAKGAATAGAAAVAGGAAAGALAQSGRAQSEASSLIATASQPPSAPSTLSTSEAASDAASFVSANPSGSPTHSSEGNASPTSLRLSSSDSDSP